MPILIQTETHPKRRLPWLWALCFFVVVLTLASLGTVGYFWILRQVEGPADTLEVLSASWVQRSPPQAELVFKLRRTDGRPASQGFTVGVAEGQPPHTDEGVTQTGPRSSPTHHYQVEFARLPRKPLVIEVTVHPTVILNSQPGSMPVIPPERDLFTRRIVVPLPPVRNDP
jgi:hypothetical protein